ASWLSVLPGTHFHSGANGICKLCAAEYSDVFGIRIGECSGGNDAIIRFAADTGSPQYRKCGGGRLFSSVLEGGDSNGHVRDTGFAGGEDGGLGGEDSGGAPG